LLALVFGWLLSRFIDYDQVWDPLTNLDGWEMVVSRARAPPLQRRLDDPRDRQRVAGRLHHDMVGRRQAGRE